MTGVERVELAEKIVSDIVHDLTDRRGLRQAWDKIDDDVKAEVVATWCELTKHRLQETENEDE